MPHDSSWPDRDEYIEHVLYGACDAVPPILAAGGHHFFQPGASFILATLAAFFIVLGRRLWRARTAAADPRDEVRFECSGNTWNCSVGRHMLRLSSFELTHAPRMTPRHPNGLQELGRGVESCQPCVLQHAVDCVPPEFSFLQCARTQHPDPLVRLVISIPYGLVSGGPSRGRGWLPPARDPARRRCRAPGRLPRHAPAP